MQRWRGSSRGNVVEITSSEIVCSRLWIDRLRVKRGCLLDVGEKFELEECWRMADGGWRIDEQ